MINKLMALEYSLLLIKSNGKKSFSELGRVIKKSCSTISRNLTPSEVVIAVLKKIAVHMFRNDKTVYIGIDDTLVRKPFSEWIEGAGRFFDTKLGRKVMGLKILIVVVNNGKYTIPVNFAFLFDKEVDIDNTQDKNAVGRLMVDETIKLFPQKKVIVTADGAFGSIEFFKWAEENYHLVEVRMHKNRKVIWKGRKVRIDEIPGIVPVGRQMARTETIVWHGMNLYVTAERRIDKNGKEKIAYLASNYHAKPSEHVKSYKRRWPNEKINRTTKQLLGLGDCYSTDIDQQRNHVAHVLLAYAFAQWERKRCKYNTPEQAIRATKLRKYGAAKDSFKSFIRIFGAAYA